MKLYVGSHDLRDPLLTPLYADLHGLPSMLIQVGEDELLLDDSIRFSDCAKAAGVDITLEIWPTCGTSGIPVFPIYRRRTRRLNTLRSIYTQSLNRKNISSAGYCRGITDYCFFADSD